MYAGGPTGSTRTEALGEGSAAKTVALPGAGAEGRGFSGPVTLWAAALTQIAATISATSQARMTSPVLIPTTPRAIYVPKSFNSEVI